MPGALAGIRVLDFGQYMAGPLLGMLLADQGADVIRIDPPSGPAWDTPANRTWNRGKRSITLDVKAAAGQQRARLLARTADVLIENFRPGVMERLGLGADELLTANPALLYTSLPGFASDDPRAGVRAWEGVVGAATGAYRTRLEGGAGGEAVYTAIPIGSSYAAFVGAASIAAALVARERDGLGQRIEVPLFDATFTAIGLTGFKVHDPSRVQRRGGLGWVRQYQCKDGRWVQFHAANTRFIEQFARAAGVEGWREDGLIDRQRFVDDPSLEHVLIERMTALFATRTAQEWEDLVNAAGTPTAICRDSAEWLDHPHARASRAVVEVADPVLGPMLQPGITPRLDATPGEVRGPAPLPGSSPSTIEWEPRTALPPSNRTPDNRGPLAGVRVLDLCIILAGPTCGRTLAEFGADVIKIDAPGREGGIAFHHDVNRGKRSILLDLKSEAGREVFWRLLEDADVVVQNYRAGAVDRIGLGHDAISARRPGIVYASLNAYGHGGPWETRPGWEQLAQATTGMQARYGGDGRPVLQPFPVNDYGTGVLGAYAVMLALRHRALTGEGQHVRSALAYTAATMQSAFMAGYAGKAWDEPRGQLAVGESPLQRLYQASDGWFFLGATAADLPTISGLPGLAGADATNGSEALSAFFEGALKRDSVAYWVDAFASIGVGAHSALTAPEVMDDPWVVAHGLSLTRDHEGIGLLTTNGPGQRLSRTPAVPGAPASLPGADAPSILEEHGLGGRLESLVRAGVIAIEAAT